MFKDHIGETPLTSGMADSFFSHINNCSYDGDVSLIATLRALLLQRMKEADEYVSVYYVNSGYTSELHRVHSPETIVSTMFNTWNIYEPGCLFIHSFTRDKESNERSFEAVASCFEKVYQGFHRLPQISEFFRASFSADCYVNPDCKSVVLFVDKLSVSKLHYLQVAIPAFLPWYFKKEDGMSELELELIYSLREKTPAHYLDCINRIASQYDFRTEKIKQLLKGFESRAERREIQQLKDKIDSINATIRAYNKNIGTLLSDKDEQMIRLLGLENKIANSSEENSEIMDYFLCNKRLILESVDDRCVKFGVCDYLEYFDRDMAEGIIENDRGFVYRYGAGSSSKDYITAEQMKRLMYEIFVNESPRLRIKFCAKYAFNLSGNVVPMDGADYSYEYGSSMPNTHIDKYSCMGNYVQVINELLQSNNYIGALEQCIASCKSLNWGDSVVMETFIEKMYKSSRKCIELPDGNMTSPRGAVEWLEEQDGVTHEQETEEKENE